MKHYLRRPNGEQLKCFVRTNTAVGQRRYVQSSNSGTLPFISKVVERRRGALEDVQNLSKRNSQPRNVPTTASSRGSQTVQPVDLRARGAQIANRYKPVQRQPSSNGNKIPFNRQSNISSGKPSSRAKGPSLERRPKQNRNQGGSTGGASEDYRGLFEPTKAEAEYAKVQAAQAQIPTIWEPEQYTSDTLSELGSSLPTGRLGLLEAYQRRMRKMSSPFELDGDVRRDDLARNLIRGNYVRFSSLSEMQDVLSLTKSMGHTMSLKRSEETGESFKLTIPEFENLSEEEKKDWEKKLIQGQYQGLVEQKAQGAIIDAVQLIRKNESYSHMKETSLMKKLGSLMPTTRPRNSNSVQTGRK